MRILFLHFARASASSVSPAASITPAASISSLIQSSHLLFGLPLFLLPTTILLSLFSTYPSSLLVTLPSHLYLHSLNFSSNSPTPIIFLMAVFRILSSLVFPIANRSILTSATFIFFPVRWSQSKYCICRGSSWHEADLLF